MKKTSMHDYADDKLINIFVSEANEQAFDVLLRRHYSIVYQRILKHVQNEEEARDICQKLWLKVLNALDQYEYNDKFQHFLNVIATNLLKDAWRSKQANRINDYHVDEELIDDAFACVAQERCEDIVDKIDNQRMIKKLVNELIPALPKEQRLVYLLKHEAELWDNNTPLQWQHLADLMAMSKDGVCDLFETTRDKLFRNTAHEEVKYPLDADEKTVFLVWTFSQRNDKRKKYTESYFAELLNVPVNTIKTRYRLALKTLEAGMNS